ncbi:MAG: phytanoyl-CoA dioxygenase family protein [Flavisolibacter sp.]|nr:phytanoyl-CoA dioxygenase family protein [Flavisolibacter sp.]
MDNKLATTVFNSTGQENSFFLDGFFVFKNFLHKNEILTIQSQVDTIVASGRDSGCVRPNNTLIALRWNDLLVELFLKSEYRIRLLKEAVAAHDLKWISGYISIKDAYSPPLWWHQDWWCWQHNVSFKKATSQIALMCYLDSTNEQNGALRVLPRSHHKTTALHAFLPEAHTDLSNQIKQEHIAMSDHKEQITLNLNPGDAVAIDYRLLHGTHENATANRRDCVMLTFTPSWKELPNDIKGHLINHHALPFSDELPVQTVYQKELLPTFDGMRKDLNINRIPPIEFEIAE